MNLDTDIQNPCIECGASEQRVNGLCSGCLEAFERPYRCESCAGLGVRPQNEWTDGVMHCDARMCDRCGGHGSLTILEARVALADAARSELMYGLESYDPTRRNAYLARAQAIGDDWLPAFWERILDRVRRLEQERARAQRAA
ncbi:MAG: hypothetical protein JNK05_34800 [Myxococcales bacterium]|nr:hypothetical protein [Myxococcales bacterium]